MFGIKTKLVSFARAHSNFYPYRRYMCKHNCIFIHIPKAAGTSILSSLAGSNKFIQRDHCSVFNFKSAGMTRFNNSFKFTFVRDPIDRLKSVHRYLLSGGNGMNNTALSNLISKDYSDFHDFVFEYLEPMRLHTEVLFKPQFSFICDEKYDVLVDYVGRYERIDEDFQYIRERLNLKSSLPHSNKSRGTSKIEVSQNVKDRIRYLYSKDFELFDY